MNKVIMSLFLISAMIFSGGCFTRTVYVTQRFPLINMPERPKLVNISSEEFSKMEIPIRDKVVYDITALTTYSKQLESEIKTYNDLANDHNEENLKKLSK